MKGTMMCRRRPKSFAFLLILFFAFMGNVYSIQATGECSREGSCSPQEYLLPKKKINKGPKRGVAKYFKRDYSGQARRRHCHRCRMSPCHCNPCCLPRGSTVSIAPRMNIQPVEAAIEPIAIDDVLAFLYEGAVIDKRAYDRSPYVVGVHHDWEDASPNDLIFVRNLNMPADSDKPMFTIFNHGRCYYHPYTKEFLGYEAEEVGTAERVKGACAYAWRYTDECGCYSPQELLRQGEPTVLRVTEIEDTIGTITVGAKVLPGMVTNYPSRFYPALGVVPYDGFILSVRSGLEEIGLNDTVVISLGAREGVFPGAVFDIYSAVYYIDDRIRRNCIGMKAGTMIPELRVGSLMVYNVYEKMSLALVVECHDDINLKDVVKNP